MRYAVILMTAAALCAQHFLDLIEHRVETFEIKRRTRADRNAPRRLDRRDLLAAFGANLLVIGKLKDVGALDFGFHGSIP